MSRMNKDFFSVGVFAESFRRMKNPGVSALVIFCLEAVLLPLGTVLSGSEWRSVRTVQGFEMHPVLLAAIFITAPMLVLTAFSGLRSRSGSDMLHALPHTRLSLYVSAYTAAAAWLGIVIFGSSLLSYGMYAVFPDVFAIYTGTLLQWSLNAYAGSLLSVSVTALATALTGTLLTNIVATLLIAFLPRVTLLLLGTAAVYDLSMTRYAWLPWIFRTENNIPAGFALGVFQVLFGVSGSGSLSSRLAFGVGPMVCTLILALLYAILGAILHVRRRSECAGRPALNRPVQSALRIGVTMSYCLLVCLLLYIGRGGWRTEWFLYFVLYLVAVLLYMLYELITSRSWRKLLHALPALGIVAVLNVCCLFSMAGMHAVEKNYAPAPEEIQSISIAEKAFDCGQTVLLRDYLLRCAADRAVTEPELLDFVSQSLAHAERGGREYTLDVCIRTVCNSRIRRIPFSEEQYQHFMQSSLGNRRCTLPTNRDDRMISVGSDTVPEGWDVQDLRALLWRELEALPVETILATMDRSEEEQLLQLRCGVRIGSVSVTLLLPVYETLTPESAAWSRAYLAAQRKQAIERVSAVLREGDAYLEGSVTVCFPDGRAAYTQLTTPSTVSSALWDYLREHISSEETEAGTASTVSFTVRMRLRDGSTEAYSFQLPGDFRSTDDLEESHAWYIYE